MVFAVRDLKSDDANMPVAGVLSSGVGFWRMLEANGYEPLAKRVIAAALALLTTWSIFSALNIPIIALEADRSGSRAIEVITLTPPRPEGPDNDSQAAGGKPQSMLSASLSQPASSVDVSTPTPISNPEWSVSRIQIVLPRARSGAGTAQGITTGIGPGRGGSGVYDPYAGATPMRGAGDNGLPQLPPDARAFARLRALVTSRGLLSNSYRCELLVALTGTVLESSCRTAGGQVSAALSELVVGQQIFEPAAIVRRTTVELSQ